MVSRLADEVGFALLNRRFSTKKELQPLTGSLTAVRVEASDAYFVPLSSFCNNSKINFC
jgi:hypothetical protein